MDKLTLPLKCTAEYISHFLSKEESTQLYDSLVHTYNITELARSEVNGETYTLNFGRILFIDQEIYDSGAFPHDIWGKTAVWEGQLAAIRHRIEELTQKTFHVAVCIYYPDGNSGVAYHSDPPAYGDTTVIPSLSLGMERLFYLKEKENQEEFEIILKDGSLLIMGEFCQERYEHCLPVDPIYKKGRINLTFRQYGFNK